MSIQVAVLIGSVIIALGLYLGLRDGENALGSGEADPRHSGQSEQMAGSADSAGRDGSLVLRPSPMNSEQAAGHVSAQLEELRSRLVEECWKPHVSEDPEPAFTEWTFSYTFDPEGRQLSRGVSEDRDTGRPAVTRCVLSSLPRIIIPAPGIRITAEVSFHLP